MPFYRQILIWCLGQIGSSFHQVPKPPTSRKGARGGNDENAPPGQISAPHAVKKGRALKVEATPAVRKSTRHQQNVLRLVLSLKSALLDGHKCMGTLYLFVDS